MLRRDQTALRAVDGVDLAIQPGETLGLVGESGCGKSTLGRAADPADRATAGASRVRRHRHLRRSARKALRAARRAMQIIFQDPFGALNPRMSVGDIIVEPLQIHGAGGTDAARRRSRSMLDLVGLPAARATASRTNSPAASASASASPARWSCVRASSSATSRSRRWTFRCRRRSSTCCRTCRRELGLTYLFIAHDLAVVQHISTAHRGDVSRQDRRARRQAIAVCRAAASLHAGADRRVPVTHPAERMRGAAGAGCPATSRPRWSPRPGAASTRAAPT